MSDQRLSLGAESWTWREVPGLEPAKDSWSHPGMTVLQGDVVTAEPSGGTVAWRDEQGAPRHTWQPDIKEAHGLCGSVDSGTASVWIVDPGFGLKVTRGKRRILEGAPGVVRYDLRGRRLVSLERPPIPLYDVHEAAYKPTAVAAADDAVGGDGTVWVADGYGTSLVHRYRRDGRYLGSLTGEEGSAGAFRNPHALTLDTRGPEPLILVADRHNSRLQAWDLDGRYRRTIQAPEVIAPSALALHGDRLFVADLRGGITVFDAEDRFVGRLDRASDVTKRPGWPNATTGTGAIRRPRLQAAAFNSPHGIAVDARGSIWVAEWVLGGRMVRLDPVPGGRDPG